MGFVQLVIIYRVFSDAVAPERHVDIARTIRQTVPRG